MKILKALVLSSSVLLLAPAFADEQEANESQMSWLAEEAGFRDWALNRCYRSCEREFQRCMGKFRPELYCKVRREACLTDCDH